MEPVKKKIKVLEATYVKEADSIAIVGECGEGTIKTQIHKSAFSFGARTEKEIDYEMAKTAYMMKNKIINLVFDPELDLKIQDKQRLNY